MDLGIVGGTLVTPSAVFRGDLYIAQGRIAAISSDRLPAARTIEADGLHVLPGVVDSHVHFMDPGAPEREDFTTGSAAAAVGGVTTVIEHTHAHPVVDAEALREKAAYLRDRSLVDFGLGAHVWPDRLDELAGVWAAGALLLKAFTCTTHGIPGILPGDLLRLFRQVAAIDAVCLVHCEDEFITADAERRLKAAGRTDPGILPAWRSREAELVATATVVLLARLTGARVVVAHASHPAVVDLVTREAGLGARVWAESCPQYFHLNEDEVLSHGSFRKFTPPARARSPEDAAQMWQRLRQGGIAYVATDHAPATRAQKQEGDIWQVHFGLPGVETTLPLMLNAVHDGHLTLQRLVEVLAEMPARLYGVYPRKGTLQIGADADLTIVDLSGERVLRDEDVVSKAGWTPYAGRRLHGQVVMTLVRGRVVAQGGKPVTEPGWGRWIHGRHYPESPP
ncbi:MAG: dihydroorotase family protein [Armatimonadota bacterium]|nr:dihydroorotase family protein [Armatimonadota bacterium]